MKKLLAILLIFTLTISLSSAQFQNYRKVEIKAVAVTSGEKPTGVIINITVIVTPGKGKVFVSTTPFTEIDMQGSAQLAAITACDLLGIDFTKHDFFYIIEADAPIVGGPSAGGVMTVATIAALKGLKIHESVYMTGMIFPDGFIGPVGGLKYKLEAAAKDGGKVFLIPKGQRVTYVEEKKVRRVGIINIITTEYKKVDLVEYGKKIGINVYEVGTINDALRFYTGYEIKKPEVNFSIGEYSELLKTLAIEMKNALQDLIDETSFKLSDEIKQIIASGDGFYRSGEYYTATSKYFQAKISIRFELYKNKIQTAKQFDDEVEKITNEIKKLKDYLAREKIGVNSFQIIAAAQERVGEAEKLLDDSLNAKSDESALYYLAYAKERVESAKIWLTLLPHLRSDYEIPNEEIQKRAQFYISQAKSLVVYASSLNGDQTLLSKSLDSISIAKRLYADGFFAGASMTAVSALTDASLSIETKYGDISTKIDEVRNAAKASLAEAEKSLFPILPAAYYEYAENLENKYAKIMYYTLSERLAKLLSVIAKVNVGKEIIHTGFPKIQQIKTPKKSRIEEIVVEAPGFEICLVVLALAVLAVTYRRVK